MKKKNGNYGTWKQEKKGWIYTKYNHEGRIKDLKNQKMLGVAKNNKKNCEKNLTLGSIISIFGLINFDYWYGCEE